MPVAFYLFASTPQRQSDMNIAMANSQHFYEIRPRKDGRGLIYFCGFSGCN
jgi:hypothetical protein